MTKNKRKKKPTLSDKLTNPIGKVTIVSLVWKDWKKEFPKSGDRIYVIVKAKNGLVPVTAVYTDETIPASKDGVFPKSRWQMVRFDDLHGTAIIGGENEECLVAWAKPRAIGNLLNKVCPLCAATPCSC